MFVTIRKRNKKDAKNNLTKKEGENGYNINKISKYSGLLFETLEEDNLKYNSPINLENMFYQTSNGSLPTVHKDFINYLLLKKYYNHTYASAKSKKQSKRWFLQQTYKLD